MTKEQIIALISAKIAGQGSAVDAGSALPAILNGILDLIPAPAPTEFLATISTTGTEEGGSTIYDVTNSQDAIDAFIASVESIPEKAYVVVKDGDLLIRFTQIEVSDTTVTATAHFSGGTYALYLLSEDAGGDSYFSFTPDTVGNEFIPTVALESETISVGQAAVKYGLTDEIWDKLTSGNIEWLSTGNSAAAKSLQIVSRTKQSALVAGNVAGAGNTITITLSLDGNYTIVVSAQ